MPREQGPASEAPRRVAPISPETFAEILQAVSSGEYIVKALEAKGISRKAFYGLLATSPQAGESYARAKLDGLERMADDALAIADDPTIEPNDKRIRVETRKWLLSKLAPKRWGDLLHLQHSGSIDLAAELEAARKRAKQQDE